VGMVFALPAENERGVVPDPDEAVATERAPALTVLLNELGRRQPSVAVMQSLLPGAKNELLLLAGDRMGADEACGVLDVRGPNLYGTLRNPTAQELFGEDGVPVAQVTVGGGQMYYARHIRELAAALGPRPIGGRRKRKSRKKLQQGEGAAT
jgi:hypothetical protein